MRLSSASPSYAPVLGVDVGGTFTDAVLLAGGKTFVAKVLSTESQAEGVMEAARIVLAAADMRADAVARFVHGMTVATNALLERRGARVALVTTEGFRDVLAIARQDRSELYTLHPTRPEPLVPRERRIGVRERIGPEGVGLALTEAEIQRVAAEIVRLRPEAVAVCLLFSFADSAHEERIASALEGALTDASVVTSAGLAPVFREFERTSTVVLDAYLTPLTSGYLQSLAGACADLGLVEPEIMQSNGGTAALVEASAHAARLLLSGPAGGAVAARWLGSRIGFADVLSFDMGGTSTDCAALVGAGPSRGFIPMETTTERVVTGMPVRLPMVDVHTVSAGGGSIAWVDSGGALKVGPESAGARPGPACYGLGGVDATVTDALVVLGRIPPGAALAGTLLPDRERARAAVAAVGSRVGLDVEEAALGIVRVATANMAAALRAVTLERGIDPRGFLLVAFGGAGGLHACDLASELGVAGILVPTRAGVLSALGLAGAPRRSERVASVFRPLDELTKSAWDGLWAPLQADLENELAAEEGSPTGPMISPAGRHREIAARYKGQSYELTVRLALDEGLDVVAARFHALHEQRYGYLDAEGRIELVTFRAVAARPFDDLLPPDPAPEFAGAGEADVRAEGGWRRCPLLRVVPSRSPAGDPRPITGPAVLLTDEAGAFVAPGWTASPVDGGVLLSRGASSESAGGSTSAASAVSFDAVDLELAVGTLQSLAEEMGVALVRSARSANIKERRDSSTAVFDGRGRLVVQAEHIPVHLGALPASVATVAHRPQERGDVWILNHPYAGGTHLPDITMVAPVISEGGIVAFLANRAHHADIGGARPGSMPVGARSLFEEGLVIPPVRLWAGGEEQEGVLDLILANCRRPEERLGDLRAQAAALALGARRLGEVTERRGAAYLPSAMAEVRAYSRRRVLAALARLPVGVYFGEDALEGDGVDPGLLPVRVAVTVSPDGLHFDFIGSAPEGEGNLNCPKSVTVSACLFIARCLLDPTPFGAAGCAEVISVATEPGTVVDARPPRGVAGGNVETSQRIVDAILDALGEALDLPAASQGTMNNLVLGSGDFSYYETIGGGGGASAGGPGGDGVHSAMTNTLNTPIEAIELEFPLRVERYELREGSGGVGAHQGGEGVIRSIRVLEPALLSVLAERQLSGPPGRRGGGAGAPGRCLVNGAPIGSKSERLLQPGDVVTIETPGGGGWGRSAARSADVASGA